MTKSTLRILSTAAVGLWLLLGVASAGAEGELTVDITNVDDSGAPQVRAVVNVLDPSGQPVPNLTPDSFQASVNGETVPIADVRFAVNSDIGVAVVITMDISGSMQGAPIQQAQTAAKAFVEGLTPVDSAAIITFGDEVTTIQNFTGDRAQLLGAIDSLQAAGDTALYQATGASAYVAASAQNQRKAIILLSDGVDHGGRSTVSRDGSIAAVRQVGAPLFAVGLGDNIDREYLAELSEASGGRFLETPTPEGLSDLFRTVGDLLRSQYVVTVSVEELDRSQPLTFALEVRSGELTGRGSRNLSPRETAPELPKMVVTGLSAGAQVEDAVSVQAQVTSDADLESVAFLVDGAEVQTFTAPPFQVGLDPRDYAGGEHMLRVEARDVRGGVAIVEVPFTAVVPAAGGGPSPWLVLVGLLVAAALVGAGGFVFFVAGRRSDVPEAELGTRVKPWTARGSGGEETFAWSNPEPPKIEDHPLGRIIVADGPQAGQAFEVGERPRRIGAASSCDIILSDDEGQMAPERARVWVSEGRLMYHRISRLSSMAQQDAPSDSWLILEPGDQFAVGPVRLIFELIASEETQPEQPLEPDATPGSSAEEPVDS